MGYSIRCDEGNYKVVDAFGREVFVAFDRSEAQGWIECAAAARASLIEIGFIVNGSK